MHQGTRVVFDETINAEGGLSLYTGLLHTDFLREAQQLGLQAIFMSSATSGNCTINVNIEHSADGRNWLNKNTSPELSGMIILTPGVGEWSVVGGESWPPSPRLRFIRLAISVTTGRVSPPAVRLRILATARSRTRAATKPEIPAMETPSVTRRDAMGRLLGIRPSTLDEVERLLQGAPAGADLLALAGQVSPAASADLHRMTRIFRNLDPQTKRATLTFAGALAALAALPAETSELTFVQGISFPRTS